MHLDIGGPRTGRTTSRAVPAILDVPGSVLVISNKRDVVDATRDLRAAADPVWVFDPQSIALEEPDWWWNPLSHVTDEARAAKLAEHFAAGSREEGSRGDAYFDNAGQDLLAALLLAAALDSRRSPTSPSGPPATPTRMAENCEFSDLVHRLCCLRGISTLTGFGLAVEVGDWTRFSGNTIAAFLGLVPTEYSSGASRSQGSITKTGNGHARRLLVEAAWHHRKTYRPGATMRTRWDAAPAAARVRGHQGHQRLHQRWQGFTARRKKPVVANVAVARELAGWAWSLAVMD